MGNGQQGFHTTSCRGCSGADIFESDVLVCGAVEIPFRRAEFEQNMHSSVAGRLAFAVPIVADRPLQNAHEVQGSIVVIDRGTSSFDTKLYHAVTLAHARMPPSPAGVAMRTSRSVLAVMVSAADQRRRKCRDLREFQR